MAFVHGVIQLNAKLLKNDMMRDMTGVELIEIIDHPKYRGTKVGQQARTELKSRSLDPETLRASALTANAAIAYSLISNDDITRESISLHDSYFLSNEDLREIYIEQLEKFIRYKDQFRFDVWSYAIGGI